MPLMWMSFPIPLPSPLSLTHSLTTTPMPARLEAAHPRSASGDTHTRSPVDNLDVNEAGVGGCGGQCHDPLRLGRCPGARRYPIPESAPKPMVSVKPWAPASTPSTGSPDPQGGQPVLIHKANNPCGRVQQPLLPCAPGFVYPQPLPPLPQGQQLVDPCHSTGSTAPVEGVVDPFYGVNNFPSASHSNLPPSSMCMLRRGRRWKRSGTSW